MKIIPKHVWHVWFTERLYSNGWAPNFRYEMASGTKQEARTKMKKLKERNPAGRFRVSKFVGPEKILSRRKRS